jgi:HAD superfamily phosphatase (TIGR01668 family)
VNVADAGPDELRDRVVELERSDWPATLRQSLPKLPRLLRALRPTWSLSSLFELNPDFLSRHGLRGLIWDVDGTLTWHHAAALDPAVAEAFHRLTTAADVRHVIASNCGELRLIQLGAMFPRIPVLKVYVGPAGTVARRVLGHADHWTGVREGPLVGLRKPDERIAHAALHELQLGPSEVAVVGDQHMTDIALANLAGLRSIKVPTIGRESFPAPVRLFQVAEQWLVRLTA